MYNNNKNVEQKQISEEHALTVDFERIMSSDIYPSIFYLILANLDYKEDYENLRRVSRHIKESMDSFKTDSRSRFKSLFSPDVCVQRFMEGIRGVSIICEHYLSTTSFNAFSLISSSTGKHRAERLKGLADVCVLENAHLLVLTIQRLPSIKLVNMINEYYIDKKIINSHLFSHTADNRPLLGKKNMPNRRKMFDCILYNLEQNVTNFSEYKSQVYNGINILLEHINKHICGVKELLFMNLVTIPMIDRGSITKKWIQAVRDVRQALDQRIEQRNNTYLMGAYM